jgi:hypothetical protein
VTIRETNSSSAGNVADSYPAERVVDNLDSRSSAPAVALTPPVQPQRAARKIGRRRSVGNETRPTAAVSVPENLSGYKQQILEYDGTGLTERIGLVDEVVPTAVTVPENLPTNIQQILEHEVSGLTETIGLVDEVAATSIVRYVNETVSALTVQQALPNTSLAVYLSNPIDNVAVARAVTESVNTQGANLSRGQRALMAAVLISTLASTVNASIVPEEIKALVFSDLDIAMPGRIDSTPENVQVGYIDENLDISTVESLYNPDTTLVNRGDSENSIPRYTTLNPLLPSNLADVNVKVTTSSDSIYLRDASGAKISRLANNSTHRLSGRAIDFRMRGNSAEGSPYMRYFEVKDDDNNVLGYLAGGYLSIV